MEKISKIRLGIALVIISISLSAILVTVGIVINNRRKNPKAWVLHSYGNNVALYSDDQIVEVYGSIMLDSLPPDDIRQLDSGISFSTKEEALSAIEDYDG